MADTTTELEVLDEIVDVLGGQSGQHKTVVPVLEDIRDLLGGGGGGGGYNPSLSVGRADALTGADETAQWATRESTGSGAATVRSVQGAAVAWNQLVPDGNFTDATKWRPQAILACSASVSDNTLRVTVTDNTAAGRPNAQPVTALQTPVSGHKYLMRADVLNHTGIAQINVSTLYAGHAVLHPAPNGVWTKVATIYTCSDTTSTTGMLYVSENVLGISNGDYVEWRNYTIIDLTQMFGSGNEPATVAEFERMYPEAYYPYSAPTLKPVQIAGIASTDAQGGELDAIEWTSQTLRAAGSVRDELTSDELVTRVGVVDLGTLTWTYMEGNDYMRGEMGSLNAKASSVNLSTTLQYTDAFITSDGSRIRFYGTGYTDAAAFKTAMSGVLLFYELATPTTTPISPALDMTYRVEQGGSESIVVPDGEVSAAPVLTVAEGESAGELVMDALACIAAPDGPTATANHAVGTYLTMQGKLYKVTRVIAVGETIAEGTNVSGTTVMAELLALTV